MTTVMNQICELMRENEQLTCEVDRVTSERDRAQHNVTCLELRVADLTRALERELHRSQLCTEAGIMAGFKQGVKTKIKR